MTTYMMQRMLEIPACWHCLMLSQQVLKNAYMSISGCVPAITKRLNNYLATCTNTRYQEQVHYITTNTNDTLNCYEQLWKDPIANSYLKIELIMFLVVVVDYSFLSFLIYLNIQSKNSIIIVSSLWPFFRWLLSMFVCLSGSWHWWKNAKYGLVTVWTARGLALFWIIIMLILTLITS